MTSQNTTATGSALDALPEALRHPHVTRFTIEPYALRPGTFQAKYEYKPFTGTEPRPERPAALYDLESVEYEAVSDLYNALLGAWARAGFTAAVREHLVDADAAWKAWTTADQALAEAYAAFDGLADGTWRSDRMALHDLQDAALKAAAEFDSAAGALARLQEDHWHDMWNSMGEMDGDAQTTRYEDVATKMGISTDGWQISDADTYKYSWSRPLTGRTQKTVAEQNERLDRAAKGITEAGDGVLELVGGMRTELETIRAERDAAAAAHRAETERMQEKIGDLADDVKDRAYERDIALREKKEAIAFADSDAVHEMCVADIEDLKTKWQTAKQAAQTATTERDKAREEASNLRTQRTVIAVTAAVIIVVLVIVSIPTWA
jgi:hypothetical protein